MCCLVTRSDQSQQLQSRRSSDKTVGPVTEKERLPNGEHVEQTVDVWQITYTVGHKKRDTFIFMITLANIDWFS